MRRREFITLVGGAAAAWPPVARAQPTERTRRIGVFFPTNPDDAETEARNAAFLQALATLGWNVGRTFRIDYRWGGGNVGHYRDLAKELVGLAPDVIVGNGTAIVAALENVTRSIPIVFANVVDPVGTGLVQSMARPGGNATGFTFFQMNFGGKWAGLLKEIAPTVTHVGVIRDSAIASQVGMLGAIQTAASSLGFEVRAIELHDDVQIKAALAALAQVSNGALIVPPAATALIHRELIISLARRYKLPAIYPTRTFVENGGLASYGPDTIHMWRQVAGYVDRILKGEKPSELPVQQPDKFEFVINLKTAKALGLKLSPDLLSTADELIE